MFADHPDSRWALPGNPPLYLCLHASCMYSSCKGLICYRLAPAIRRAGLFYVYLFINQGRKGRALRGVSVLLYVPFKMVFALSLCAFFLNVDTFDTLPEVKLKFCSQSLCLSLVRSCSAGLNITNNERFR